MKDASVRRWSRVHTHIYRATGGRLGRRVVDNDMLLLTTSGYRTKKPHTVPLLCLRDGERFVVIASYGGRPQHPTWYRNLVAEPRVNIQFRDGRRQMIARTTEPEEREVWWPRIIAAYEGYSLYQSRTDRIIPVVFLEPRD